MKKESLLKTGSFAFALLALAAGGCYQSAPPMTMPPAAVTVVQPTTREIIEWDEYPGRLEAVQSVEVRARVNGYLQSINFKDGAEVKKGDLLFVIDPRPYQAELDHAQADIKQAESRFELASNDLERAERLLKSRAISAEEADSRSKSKTEAEAAVGSSRATYEMAKINLDYCRITSPIDGRIGRKMMTEGNLVNGTQGDNTLLTTIVSIDPIYCYFDADERAILKYQEMQRAGTGGDFRAGTIPCEVQLANETDYPHHGLLDFVDNRVDPTTGTLRVRGLIPNPDHTMQPGYFAKVRVPGSTKYSAILVPDEAIGTDQGQKFVYVVNADTVEYKTVKLGPVVDGLRVIRSGIATNDWVMINGLMSVRPGAKANATRVPANPAATGTNAPVIAVTNTPATK